jgi:hypothetical protein
MNQDQLRGKCNALGLSEEAGTNSTLRKWIYAKLKEMASGIGTNGVVDGTAMMVEEQEQVEQVQVEPEEGKGQSQLGIKRKISLKELAVEHGVTFLVPGKNWSRSLKKRKISLEELAVKEGVTWYVKKSRSDVTLNAIDVTLKELCCKYGFTAQMQTTKRLS